MHVHYRSNAADAPQLATALNQQPAVLVPEEAGTDQSKALARAHAIIKQQQFTLLQQQQKVLHISYMLANANPDHKAAVGGKMISTHVQQPPQPVQVPAHLGPM